MSPVKFFFNFYFTTTRGFSNSITIVAYGFTSEGGGGITGKRFGEGLEVFETSTQQINLALPSTYLPRNITFSRQKAVLIKNLKYKTTTFITIRMTGLRDCSSL